MGRKSSYIFKAATAALALGALPGVGNQKSHATIVTNADFTFETSAVAATAAGTGPTYLADIGTGTAFGVHTASSTYSSPSGNGSSRSYSSNQFAVNDYYQFNVPTTGLTGILVSFDQISSSTGPGQFTFEYSTDGTNFSSVSGYTLLYSTYTVTSTNTAGSATASSGFSTGASSTAFNVSFDLSSITGLNGDSSAEFRLVDASTVSLNGGTVGTSGTDRVDNFVVSGTAVPEPASLAVLSVAGMGLLARRRRNEK